VIVEEEVRNHSGRKLPDIKWWS